MLCSFEIKMLKELVAFCAVLGISLAAVGLARLEPKPEKFSDVEGCYIKQLDIVIPFGEARPSTKECMEYRCDTDSVQYASCGIAAAAPPQTLVVHPERPYPQCCPTLDKDIQPTNSTVESTNKL